MICNLALIRLSQNAKELMSFPGFMNNLHNYLPGFAKVSADMFTLAHAKVFALTRQHQICYKILDYDASG